MIVGVDRAICGVDRATADGAAADRARSWAWPAPPPPWRGSLPCWDRWSGHQQSRRRVLDVATRERDDSSSPEFSSSKEDRTFATPLDPRDGLAEVDVDAPVVDEYVVHLEVGVLARLGVVELDEGVLQRVARVAVADDLAAAMRTRAVNRNRKFFVSL